MCYFRSPLALFAGALILLPAAAAAAGDLLEPFEIFRPLFGARWTGAYVGEDAGDFTHVFVWEPILKGRAVRRTKEVPEAGFRAETLYFWDADAEKVGYLTVTNNDNVVRGHLDSVDGVLIEEGRRFGSAGDDSVRTTFERLPDGTLEDLFFIAVPGGWHQGHRIHYRAGAL